MKSSIVRVSLFHLFHPRMPSMVKYIDIDIDKEGGGAEQGMGYLIHRPV
jgi:hypothetical protein